MRVSRFDSLIDRNNGRNELCFACYYYTVGIDDICRNLKNLFHVLKLKRVGKFRKISCSILSNVFNKLSSFISSKVKFIDNLNISPTLESLTILDPCRCFYS
jgi:hypothetical protein